MQWLRKIGDGYWRLAAKVDEHPLLSGIVLFLAVLWTGAIEGFWNKAVHADVRIALWIRPALVVWAVCLVSSRNAPWSVDLAYVGLYATAGFAGMAASQFIIEEPIEAWRILRLTLEFMAIGTILGFFRSVFSKATRRVAFRRE